MNKKKHRIEKYKGFSSWGRPWPIGKMKGELSLQAGQYFQLDFILLLGKTLGKAFSYYIPFQTGKKPLKWYTPISTLCIVKSYPRCKMAKTSPVFQKHTQATDSNTLYFNSVWTRNKTKQRKTTIFLTKAMGSYPTVIFLVLEGKGFYPPPVWSEGV